MKFVATLARPAGRLLGSRRGTVRNSLQFEDVTATLQGTSPFYFFALFPRKAPAFQGSCFLFPAPCFLLPAFTALYWLNLHIPEDIGVLFFALNPPQNPPEQPQNPPQILRRYLQPPQ